MFTWLLENYETLLLIVGGLLAVAGAVVALTPNKKDDEVVGKVRRVFDAIMGFLGRRSPSALPAEPERPTLADAPAKDEPAITARPTRARLPKDPPSDPR